MSKLFISNYKKDSDKRIKHSDISNLEESQSVIYMPYLKIELPELRYRYIGYIYVNSFFSAYILDTEYKFCIFTVGETLILSIIKYGMIKTSIQITRDIDISSYEDISFILEKIEKFKLLE